MGFVIAQKSDNGDIYLDATGSHEKWTSNYSDCTIFADVKSCGMQATIFDLKDWFFIPVAYKVIIE